MRRVAITHVAQSCGVESRESLMDFTYQVNKEILDKAGLRRTDVGCIISGSADIFHSGLSCANAFDWDSIGAFLKEGSRAEESAMSFIYGCMRILSGHYDTVLVNALVKGSENPDNDPITSFYGDPFYLRPVGINESAVAAMQMRQYMNRYQITEEQCAKVAVKNLGNALFNPYAHVKKRVSLADVMNSERLYDPLKALECAPKSDGVVAVLVASEDRAKKLTDKPVWLSGYGCSMDHFIPGDRDLLNGELKAAAKRAYGMAGIRKPFKKIDVAEVCEPYAFQELLWCEQLGLCGEGEGGDLIDSGVTEMNGTLPVNPSGGVLATNPNPPGASTGLPRRPCSIKVVAGEHQVGKKVKTALAHSTHGFGGQCHPYT